MRMLNTMQSSKLRFLDLGKRFGRNPSIIGMESKETNREFPIKRKPGGRV